MGGVAVGLLSSVGLSSSVAFLSVAGVVLSMF